MSPHVDVNYKTLPTVWSLCMSSFIQFSRPLSIAKPTPRLPSIGPVTAGNRGNVGMKLDAPL